MSVSVFMRHGLAVPLGAWDGAAQAPPAPSALARTSMALLLPLTTELRAWRQWRRNFVLATSFDPLRDLAAETYRSTTPFTLCIHALPRPRACHVLAPWACRLCLLVSVLVLLCHGLAVPSGAWDGAALAPPALSALARMTLALLLPLITVLRA